MKLYDFHCDDCGRDFEELVRIASDARCRTCDSKNVVRTLSRFSVGVARRESAPASASCAPRCGSGTCGLD